MQDFKEHQKKQGNTILPNEHKRFLVTNHSKMEIHKLTDKKIQNNGFKLAQQATGNTDKQLNKIRKIIHEQNWKFNKDKS